LIANVVKMLRRFSSQFRKDKNKEDKATAAGKKASGATNGVNGTYATNGTTAPAPAPATTPATAPVAKHSKEPSHAASRQDVESSFTQFAQLVHAAQRPLPNQTGDGTYVDEAAHHSSLWQDMRSLGFKDAKTLAEVMKNTASGALVDDKTMLMERVIQVHRQSALR
jgi:hypothetical protein